MPPRRRALRRRAARPTGHATRAATRATLHGSQANALEGAAEVSAPAPFWSAPRFGRPRGSVTAALERPLATALRPATCGSTKPAFVDDGPGPGRVRAGVGSKGTQPTWGK